MLSKEIFNPVISLEFVYTQKCNIKCDHCINESGLEKTSKIELSSALSVIDAAEKAGVEQIGITGGESLLYLKEMLEIISFSNNKGLTTKLISNGFWGSSLQRAKEMLLLLENAGLKNLNISTDEFHLKFIPNKSIMNIFDAARSISSINFILRVAYSGNYSFFDFIGENRDYFRKIKNDAVPFTVFMQPVIPFGRAKEKVEKNNFVQKKKVFKQKCPFLGHPVMNHDKRFFVCCNYFESDETAFNFADGKTVSAEKAIDSYRNNFFVFFQRHKGPHFIHKLAEKNKLNKLFDSGRILEKSTGLCDYCKLSLAQYSGKDLNELLEKEFNKDKKLQKIALKEKKDFLRKIKEKQRNQPNEPATPISPQNLPVMHKEELIQIT